MVLLWGIETVWNCLESGRKCNDLALESTVKYSVKQAVLQNLVMEFLRNWTQIQESEELRLNCISNITLEKNYWPINYITCAAFTML